MCDRLSLLPPQGQPHAVFGGYHISISGGWMLLRKKLMVAEDNLHITVEHRVTTS